MSRHDFHFDGSERMRDRRPDVDPQLLHQLTNSVKSPDLTRSIMGRLGYMNVSPKVARRHRLRRWSSRAGISLVAALAMAVGMKFYVNSDQIRRPVGPTIPAALGQDLQRQQDRLGNVIQTIRSLSAPRPATNQPAQPQDEPRPLNDDVHGAPHAPIRWV